MSIRYFAQDPQGRLNIGYDEGILTYPLLVGDNRYLDVVDINAVGDELIEDSFGIPTKISLNWGSIYELTHRYVINEFIIDYRGQSKDGAGKFFVRLYRNLHSTPFHTITFKIDQKMGRRVVPPVGPFDSLQLEIELDKNDLKNFKEFTISRISLGVVRREKSGNI